MQKIDVVMPIAPKDTAKAKHSLKGILQNSLNPIRNIYIITPQKFIIDNLPDIPLHWVLDHTFPFSINDIRQIFHKKNAPYDNAAWYYQQLLKLYVFRVIKGVLDNVLILDSDFMLTRKTKFLSDDGRAILSFGYPFRWLLGTNQYPAQVTHIHATFAARLIPGWYPQHLYSGMQHHMLLQRSIAEHLFSLVEGKWNIAFWQAFINQVDLHKWNGASEYVIYHHFALCHHPEKIYTRHLDACDLIFDSKADSPAWPIIENLTQQPQYNAVGFHGFYNLKERLATMDYIPDSLKQDMLGANQLVFKLMLQNGVLAIEGL